MAKQVSVVGERPAVIDGLAEIVGGAAQSLLLNPAFDQREHLERPASENMSRL
jgi:hypothetical protein